MHNIDQQVSEESFECLPGVAWLFMAVAVVPHLLAQIGFDALSRVAALLCFPGCMGPFAIAHSTIIRHQLGFTTHMAWMSALLFSLVWFAIICGSWRRNRNLAVGIGLFSFLYSARLVWLIIAPL